MSKKETVAKIIGAINDSKKQGVHVDILADGIYETVFNDLMAKLEIIDMDTLMSRQEKKQYDF